MGTPHAFIDIAIGGQTFHLTRDLVDRRLERVTPEDLHKHAVQVNGTWYPPKQVFELATGIPPSQFNSHTALKHLAALGYPQRETNEAPAGTTTDPDAVTAPEQPVAPAASAKEWHNEAQVQAAVVKCLVEQGWSILAVANAAKKEPGVDVIASRDQQTVGMEVKGYPSKGYADPAKAGQIKKAAPSTQARVWYAQAVLAAMQLRTKEPGWRSVITLPDFPTYRSLHTRTRTSLEVAGIEVWWVSSTGQLTGN